MAGAAAAPPRPVAARGAAARGRRGARAPQLAGRAVRWDVLQPQALGGREAGERPDLVGDGVLELARGDAHLAAADEAEALDDVKRLLAHLPQNNLADPPIIAASDPRDRMDGELDTIVPDEPAKPYDMHDGLTRVVDNGADLEARLLALAGRLARWQVSP